MPETNYKLELHCHTAESSTCGRVPADETVQLYKDAGYDAIMITDHLSAMLDGIAGLSTWDEKVDYHLNGYKLARAKGEEIGVKVYQGAEIRFPGSCNDYLLFGMTEEILRANPYIYNTTPAEFKAFADANGILIVQAHPFRENCTPAAAENLHGMEIYNGHDGHDSRNDLAKEYAEKHGLIPTAGSDCHYYHAVGTASVNTTSLPADMDRLIAMLKSGNYTTKVER